MYIYIRFTGFMYYIQCCEGMRHVCTRVHVDLFCSTGRTRVQSCVTGGRSGIAATARLRQRLRWRLTLISSMCP